MPASLKRRHPEPVPVPTMQGPALITYIRPKYFKWKQLPTQAVIAAAMGIETPHLVEIWRCIDQTLSERTDLFKFSFASGCDDGKQEFCDKVTAEFLHKLDNKTLMSLMAAVDTDRSLVGFFLWKFALKRRSHIKITRGGGLKDDPERSPKRRKCEKGTEENEGPETESPKSVKDE